MSFLGRLLHLEAYENGNPPAWRFSLHFPMRYEYQLADVYLLSFRIDYFLDIPGHSSGAVQCGGHVGVGRNFGCAFGL